MDLNINTSIQYHNFSCLSLLSGSSIFEKLSTMAFQKVNWKHEDLQNTELEMYKSKNKFYGCVLSNWLTYKKNLPFTEARLSLCWKYYFLKHFFNMNFNYQNLMLLNAIWN